MCETKLKLQVVLIVLCMAIKGLQAVDDCKHMIIYYYYYYNSSCSKT